MKISIVIPIYNKSKYINNGFRSLLAQSERGLEIICIDDGSTDGSIEIVKDIARKDSRIKLMTQQNQGAGAARNTGIKAAKGEYIAFLDADDYYPSANTLARLYAAAKTNNALICGGSLITWDGSIARTNFPENLSGNKFEKEGWVNFSDYQYDYAFYRFIYRREFLVKNGLYFPDYRRYQDPPFMLRAFARAGRFYAIPDATYCYRINSAHMDWTRDKVLDLLCGIEDNLKFPAANGYERLLALNYMRLNNDFRNAIVNVAVQYDGEGKILKKLIDVQRAANSGMLAASGRISGDEMSCSRSLSEIIVRLSAQGAQIKKEGWFINKKIFKAYTWPIRAAGKLARRIKYRDKDR